MKKFYLSEAVICEPLLWNWYAWGYLYSPVTGSLLLKNHYLKILESYLQSPEAHAEVMKHPQLRAGAFLDDRYVNYTSIEELHAETLSKYEAFIRLPQEIAALQGSLHEHCTGESLTAFYEELPESCKGRIELNYDTINQANIKILEPLFDKHFLPTHEHHSFYFQKIDIDTSRPCVMNTPRIADRANHAFSLKMSLANRAADDIFKLRTVPQPLNDIMDSVSLGKSIDEQYLRSFLTEEGAQSTVETTAAYACDKIRVRYMGHAGVLLQTNNVSILIDPIINYHANMGGYTYTDLPETIDYVLITHAHQDHLCYETLLQLRHKIKHIIVPDNNKNSLVDPSIKYSLQELNFNDVRALSEFESISFDEGEILGLPFWGEHCDLNIFSKLSYIVTLKGRRFFFVADSDNFEPKLYENIFANYAKVDCLFVGLECEGAPMSWLYGPFMTKGIDHKHDISRRLSGSNAQKALDLVTHSGCSTAYVYAMGMEKWVKHIIPLDLAPDAIQLKETEQFKHLCINQGVRCKQLFGKYEEEFTAK